MPTRSACVRWDVCLIKCTRPSLGVHQSRAGDWDRDGECYVAVQCDGKSEREAALVFSSRRPGHAAQSARTPERLHVKVRPPRSVLCGQWGALVPRCYRGMKPSVQWSKGNIVRVIHVSGRPRMHAPRVCAATACMHRNIHPRSIISWATVSESGNEGEERQRASEGARASLQYSAASSRAHAQRARALRCLHVEVVQPRSVLNRIALGI